MSVRWLLPILVLALFVLLIPSAVADADKKPTADKQFTPEQVTFFEKEVLPILEANCTRCHGESKARGDLRLDTREGVLKGGKKGADISLDKPETSRLLAAIRHKGLKMPPDGKLGDKQIEVLSRWVKAGIPWKPGVVAVAKEPPREPIRITEETRNYWAYKPVQRPVVPPVKNKAWIRNPIDAFILSGLETKGLSPAPPADRVALIRRATYDLTGLPPTPEQIDAFLADHSPDAYEKLIDRLLASPHYGEKWGRHWLDLVRYAETNGYERDGAKPFVWRYRDYVIRSFNDDKPYDRFIKEQLAGDEIDRENADAVIATGYFRLGIWDDEPADPAQARADEMDDLVATTGQVFLGMTMNCARCHDHKIDPIPQRDYYQLAAFFRDIQPYNNAADVRTSSSLTDITPPQTRANYEKNWKIREIRQAELQEAMTKIEDEAIKKMPAVDQRATEGPERPKVIARKLGQFLTTEQSATYAKLKDELEVLRQKLEPGRELALSVANCLVDPPRTHILARGNPHSPGVEVKPGFPEVLGAPTPVIPTPVKDARSSGRRTVLANWIASEKNPLTARVMANRLWQHHFGRGIVATSNDFGKFGSGPTHPELLDWLAGELVAGGWKLKRMHKLLMMSSAYQMSSKATDRELRDDPENTLFWRFNMRRLTAEEVRDSILAASGKLNPKMGGPSFYPVLSREVLAGQSMPGNGWGKSPAEETIRRSVYIHSKRSLLVPILSTHDLADTDTSCPVRYTTTVPTQVLGMLNGEFTNEHAAAFADRLRRESTDDLSAQVRRAIRLTTGHVPKEDEVKRDFAFIKNLESKGKLSERDALKHYCLLAVNTNEFIYLD